MFVIVPSRRRVMVLLFLLVALPCGLVGGFALVGSGLALNRALSGTGPLSPGEFFWKASVAVVLIGVAGAAIAGIARQIRAPDRALSMRSASDPNPARIASNSRDLLWLRGLFAGAWNAVFLPVAAVTAAKEWGQGWAWLWVLLFPALGLVMLPDVIRAWRDYRRHPDAWLELDPAQPARGARLESRFVFPDGMLPPGSFRAVLRCIESTKGGRRIGFDRGETIHTTVWSEERQGAPRGRELRLAFTPAASAFASGDAGNAHHFWRVELHYPEEDAPRTFNIAVR